MKTFLISVLLFLTVSGFSKKNSRYLMVKT